MSLWALHSPAGDPVSTVVWNAGKFCFCLSLYSKMTVCELGGGGVVADVRLRSLISLAEQRLEEHSALCACWSIYH